VKKKRTYIQLKEGDSLMITKRSRCFNFKCCDCGLTHKVTIKRNKEGIILQFNSLED